MPTSQAEIVSPSALPALEPEWDALWRRCPDASPFESPAWLLPWARRHALGRCGAAALRAEGRLVGLAPVFCWDGALLLAGTGPSDRADVLLAPGWEAEAVRLLSALPSAAPEPFDRIDLQQLPPTSPFLHAPLPGWREERALGDPSLVAPLSGEDGLGNLSRRRRENWHYAVRRLEREEAQISLAAPEEVGSAMDDLFRLHALRWNARGEPGVLGDGLMRAFLLDAAPALEQAGLLRLHQATLHGKRIAVLLVLAGPRTHHYYIGGFDPAVAHLSPSAALIGTAMAMAHREGATAFDFLRGLEPYKMQWAATPRLMHRRVLHPA